MDQQKEPETDRTPPGAGIGGPAASTSNPAALDAEAAPDAPAGRAEPHGDEHEQPEERAQSTEHEPTSIHELPHGHERSVQHAENVEHRDHAEDEFHGLKSAFRERAIAFRTMEKPLRLMAGLAVVQLLVAAVLVPLRDLSLPAIPVYVVDTHLVQSPLVIYIAAIGLLALAWSYLIAGALQAYPIVRLIGLGAFTWASTLVQPSDPPAGLGIAWAILVSLPWLVGLWSVVRDVRVAGLAALALPMARRARPLPWPATVLVALAVLAVYGVAFVGDRHGAVTLLFTSKVTLQLSTLQFALIPILFLAGVDFAEWGALTMERVSLVLETLRRPAAALAAAALGALAVLGVIAYDYRHSLFVSHHTLPLVEDGGMGLVVLALLALLVRAVRPQRGRHRSVSMPQHVPYAALVAMTLLYAVVMGAISVANTAPASQRAVQAFATQLKTTTYRHETAPRFTLRYPDMWQVQVLEDAGPRKPLFIMFNGIASGNPGVITLIRTSAAGEPTFAKMRTDWFRACCSKRYTVAYDHPQTVGPWHAIHFTEYARATRKPVVAGRVWYRAQGDAHWMFQDEAAIHFQTFDAPVFETMVLSFRADDAPGAYAQTHKATPVEASAAPLDAATDGDYFVAEAAPFLLLVAVLGLAALLWRTRRGRGGLPSAGLLFVAIFCGYGVATAAHSVSVTALARLGPLGHIPHLSIIGLQIAVALATLAGVTWASATGRTGTRWGELALLALGLNGALQILSWIYDLFTNAMDLSGRFGVAQAVVIILALTWDVLMSGETVTNRDGTLFPRSARVLLFFGYMCFTAVNLLYFSTLHVQATGERLEAQFESEMWVQNGIVVLGVPLLLTLFLLGAGRWMRGAAAGTTVQAPTGPPPGGARATEQQPPAA